MRRGWRLPPDAPEGSSIHSLETALARVSLNRGGSPQDIKGRFAAASETVYGKVIIEGDHPEYAKPFHQRERGSVDQGKVLVRELRPDRPGSFKVGINRLLDCRYAASQSFPE